MFIRPISALLELGVLYYWTCVSGKRTTKREKKKLTLHVPQCVPQNCCRKPYLIDGYFQHREAIKGFYEKQIQSKYYRHLEKVYGPVFKADELYSQMYSRHFRKYYNRKPTKRYLKIIKQINEAKYINDSDLISVLLK